MKKIIALALAGIALAALATAPADAKSIKKSGGTTITSLSVIPGLNGCCG